MTLTAAGTTVDLAGGHTRQHCRWMAEQLKAQLDSYRKGAAVMPIGGNFDDWLIAHRTARRRMLRAHRLGYRFALIKRQDHELAIHRINKSAPERQGRPMAAGYQEQPSYGPNPVECERHHVYPYGILTDDDQLVAYLWLYRSGELAMVSSILGHADHLDDGIMYHLYVGMVGHQWPLGGTVFYNLWKSGTDGLRFYKERVGLTPGDVDWTVESGLPG